MRWLPRLFSHSAAAGRVSAARTTSHVRLGSHGFASGGGGGGDGLAVPRVWLRKLWDEELRKQKEAAKRWGIGGTGDSLGVLASSEEPALQDGRVMARGAADKPPSRSYQYDDRDLKPVEVKLAPLLARANLVIARDIEWANIMLAFEQESRYIIMDPIFPQSPVGFIREKSNVIVRQDLGISVDLLQHSSA